LGQTLTPKSPSGDDVGGFFRQVWVQAKEFGQNGIASVSQLDRFQPGEQTTLPLVKLAVEKQVGGFEFIGRDLRAKASVSRGTDRAVCLVRS
jgi:urease beta subunit